MCVYIYIYILNTHNNYLKIFACESMFDEIGNVNIVSMTFCMSYINDESTSNTGIRQLNDITFAIAYIVIYL